MPLYESNDNRQIVIWRILLQRTGCTPAVLVLAGGLTVGQEASVTLIARRMKDYPVNWHMSDIYLTDIILCVG